MLSNVKSLILCGLVLCATNAFAAPAQILIIRHAEKPDSGPDLSPQGWKRAYALVDYFQKDPAVTKFGTPAAIYAAGFSQEEKASFSRRSVQTVTPLAQALGLEIHSSFRKHDLDLLVKEIMSEPAYEGKMVLICWEHKVIPDMAFLFGVSPRPADWPGNVFDQVFELDFTGNQLIGFSHFSEKVMPGDSD